MKYHIDTGSETYRKREAMFLRNTSTYLDDEVRELVEFATKGVNMKKVCVNVKGHSRSWGGTAYSSVPDISNAPPSAEYLVTIRIAPTYLLNLPYGPWNYHRESPEEAKPNGRFPFYTWNTWEEILVGIAAHEAKHIWQFRHGKSLSEVVCEKWMCKKLEEFRNR